MPVDNCNCAQRVIQDKTACPKAKTKALKKKNDPYKT
jgi:hypothetical protein